MSVYVSKFAAGVWDVTHDDAPGGPHGGTLAPTAITFGVAPDGSTDYRTAVIACPFPGCNSTSYHPIGGGAQPRSVQETFIRMMMRLGCPCGSLASGKAAALVIIHARGHVTQTENAARWQVASIVP